MQSREIGEILVEQGVLDSGQVEEVAERQMTDDRSFNQIASELFGLDPHDLSLALARHIETHPVRSRLARERLDPACLAVISPREAWDHLVLPLRIESGELVCATTVETLASAIELLERRIDRPFRLVITDVAPLEQFIAERYAFEGIDLAG